MEMCIRDREGAFRHLSALPAVVFGDEAYLHRSDLRRTHFFWGVYPGAFLSLIHISMKSPKSSKRLNTGLYISLSSSGQMSSRVDVYKRQAQITAVQIRFIPEYYRGQCGQVTERTLLSPHIEWVDAEGEG